MCLFQPVQLNFLTSITAIKHTQCRLSKASIKTKCCTFALTHFCPLHPFIFLLSFPNSLPALNMEELICSFYSQHLILFIFFLPFFPLSPYGPLLFLRQDCAVRPFQSTGVVRSDGWLSTFCCLPLRSWEIYRLADYQAWKPISLSHSFTPLLTSMPASLLPSHSLNFNIRSVIKKQKKNTHNREMCAKQHWNLCADRGKQLLPSKVIVEVSEGNSMFRDDTPGLWQPIFPIFIFSIASSSFKYFQQMHPSTPLLLLVIIALEEGARLIAVSK